ncbi:MAG: hypothetical protein QM639_10220 [Rhodocyclaceae bacterium]
MMKDINFTQLLALNAAFDSARAQRPLAMAPLPSMLAADSVTEGVEFDMLALLGHVLDQPSEEGS